MTNMKIFVFFAALVLILHCVTGQPTRSDSEAQNQSLKGYEVKSILVATGSDGNNRVNEAQVVILNESNTCSLPPVPKAFSYGTGGVVDNSIILCGGQNGEERLSTCHIFDNESKTWKTTNMSSRRNYPASAPLNGALWVSGGNDENGRLSTSELIYPNGTIRTGPSLPSKMSWHSVVTLKEEESYMVIDNDGNVYMYNALSESFSKNASTGNVYGHPACASFKSAAHGNRPVVVCVGRRKEAKLFDYTKASKWEQIPDLPTSNPYGVQFGATAITSVDGSGVYVQYDEKFYELDCSNECKWTVMSQTLPKAVRHGIMMYIPPELTCFS